jgi:hypothetical protein
VELVSRPSFVSGCCPGPEQGSLLRVFRVRPFIRRMPLMSNYISGNNSPMKTKCGQHVISVTEFPSGWRHRPTGRSMFPNYAASIARKKRNKPGRQAPGDQCGEVHRIVTGLHNWTQTGKGIYIRTLCQENEGPVEIKQRPTQMGGRITYRTLPPKRAPFQTGTDRGPNL